MIDLEQAHYFRVVFMHNRHGTRHTQDVIVYCRCADLWSAGEAMAKRDGSKFFSEHLQREYLGAQTLHDYSLLSVACLDEHGEETE